MSHKIPLAIIFLSTKPLQDLKVFPTNGFLFFLKPLQDLKVFPTNGFLLSTFKKLQKFPIHLDKN